ncbi:PREDICTED: chaoptin-like [Nicrophorus vespilloides]|uniref:Chaoptin-like n=1 Tax=Nicrophorus vespilloides TaxID=110193 RepID=A0ABM1N7S5_NICVS|nr:PREDICTED: chaoptin-like [Nicrophorus vespilloides]
MLVKKIVLIAFFCINVIRCKRSCKVRNNCTASCEGGNYTELSNMYICINLKTVQLGFNNLDAKALQNISRYKIDELFLNNNGLASVEQIFQRSNIRKLYLEDNNISALETDSFKDNHPLEVLSLHHNRIHVMHENSIPKAKEIHLNNNLIQAVNANMFVDISYTSVLIFDYNVIKMIETVSFRGLKAKQLHLRYNRIDYLEANSIPAVEEVYLTGNRLISINAFVFVNISSVSILHIDFNNLSNIVDNTFLESRMRELNLDSNKINRINANTFAGMKGLVNLTLSNNFIEYLEISSLPNVRNLQLQFNFIRSIDTSKFQDFHQLLSLNVSYNCIPESNTDKWKNEIRISNVKSEEMCRNIHEIVIWVVILVLLIIVVIVASTILYRRYSSEWTKEMFKENLSIRSAAFKMLTSVLIFLAIAWIDVISSDNSSVCEVDKKCFADCENHIYTYIRNNHNCNSSISILKLGSSNIMLNDLIQFEYYNIEFLHLNNKSLDKIDDVINKMNVSKLNMDNNKIVMLNSSCFRNESSFKLLSLNNNSIKVIETKSIPKAKDIYLNQNFIEIILADMFVDITLVEMLHLENNCLKTLTDKSLTGLTASRLTLRYNEIEKLEANSIPTVQQVYLNRNRLESLDANIFVNISYIGILDLSSNNISNISEGTFKDGYFSVLNLYFNNITKITKKTFSGLTRTLNLSLSHNEIEVLEDGSIPRVENLDLENNPLKGIHEAEFSDLTYLKEVKVTSKDDFDISLPNDVIVLNSGVMVKHYGMFHFIIRKSTVYAIGGVILIIFVAIVIGIIAKNQCSKRSRVTQHNSVHLGKEVRNRELPEVSASGAQYNEYEEIDPTAESLIYSKENDFYGVQIENNGLQIEILNINYNNITELKTGMFEESESFRTVSLGNNQIKVLQRNSIPKAFFLYLNNNLIELLNTDMFIDISYVKCLHLNNNRLKKITALTLMGLKAITLELSHNQLEDLEDRSIPEVEKLFMNNNKLTSINSKMFLNISHLSTLELIYNRIIDITNWNFKNSNLSILKLNYNKIFKITQKSFSDMKMLMNLSLTNNLISSLEMNSIPKVKYLNLSYNLLTSIEANVFSELDHLKILDIRYNCIKETDLKLMEQVLILNGEINEKCMLNSNRMTEMDIFLISKIAVLAVSIVILVVAIAAILIRVYSRRQAQTSVSFEKSKKDREQQVEELKAVSKSEEHIYEEINEKLESVEYSKENDIYGVTN